MEKPIFVETRDLTKMYGDVAAVDRLNLRVAEGEVFGFLGPNGAGKTTTILMLLGLTESSSGTARVCGLDPLKEALKVRRITGYLPENVGFYEDMTGRENLAYTASLNHVPYSTAKGKIDDVLSLVGLSDRAKDKVEKYSKGMKQRLGIADVLIKDPRVVFLDEPTVGIDPDGVRRILDIISHMSRDKKITVFLSSHLLHQVQTICTRIGILVKGRLVAEGPIARLGKEVLGSEELKIEVQATGPVEAVRKAVSQLEGVKEVETTGDLLLVRASKDVRASIAGALAQQGSSLLHLKLQDYALEEIYMKYFV